MMNSYESMRRSMGRADFLDWTFFLLSFYFGVAVCFGMITNGWPCLSSKNFRLAAVKLQAEILKFKLFTLCYCNFAEFLKKHLFFTNCKTFHRVSKILNRESASSFVDLSSRNLGKRPYLLIFYGFLELGTLYADCCCLCEDVKLNKGQNRSWEPFLGLLNF